MSSPRRPGRPAAAASSIELKASVLTSGFWPGAGAYISDMPIIGYIYHI